jgi:Na+-transporting NADH:ubiquinone oxidoreductase subunit NqrC
MAYKTQDGISSEDLKRIANEQIMEKIKDIARQVYKEEKKKEMEELIKDVIKKEGTI